MPLKKRKINKAIDQKKTSLQFLPYDGPYKVKCPLILIILKIKGNLEIPRKDWCVTTGRDEGEFLPHLHSCRGRSQFISALTTLQQYPPTSDTTPGEKRKKIWDGNVLKVRIFSSSLSQGIFYHLLPKT